MTASGESFFRGCLGVAVKIKDKDAYWDEYNEIVTKLSEKYQLKRKRHVLKSYAILSALGYPNGPNFLEEFFENIKTCIEYIDVYYTTIPSTKVPEIKKYGAHRTSVEVITPVEFLKELDAAYSHCCAWAYIRDHAEEAMTPILIDHFQGELTEAWIQIRSLPTIKVYFAGDECNCFISTADIITKLIDIRLYKLKQKLYADYIANCLPKDILGRICFLDQLKLISPISKEKIDVVTKLAHPIIFVMKEGLYPEVVGSAKERDVLSTSPIMDEVMNKAFEIDGCVKVFDMDSDQSLIHKGDIFVYLGEKGMKTCRYLQNLGYDIRMVSAEELKSIK
jgi:hypothetical protein